MSRVSSEAIKKLNDFIAALPEEARSKCALCNETLTHIVKMAEAETGAGTATVTRALADKINAAAAPGDRVTPRQLEGRVERQEGTIAPNRGDSASTEARAGAGRKTAPANGGLRYAVCDNSNLSA